MDLLERRSSTNHNAAWIDQQLHGQTVDYKQALTGIQLCVYPVGSDLALG